MGGREGEKDRLIICYCPLMSLQVFIQDITDTKILTVAHVHLCVPYCALLYNPGCKWSLLEQRMRPLPSISLIKSKLLPLSLSLSRPYADFIFCSFCPFLPKSEKNDVSLSGHSKPRCSCLGGVLAEWRSGSRTPRMIRGLVCWHKNTFVFFYALSIGEG